MDSSVTGRTIRRGLAVIGLVSVATGACLADEGPIAAPVAAIHEQAIDRAQLPPVAAAATLDALGTSTAIPDDVLGAASAMARVEVSGLVINDQNVTGIVEGNTATNTTNGENSISGNAFAGAAGFATAIQNTGNNVLIQNSTIINVSMDP